MAAIFQYDIFKSIFFSEKVLISIIITEISSQRSNKQYYSIGSDTALAPARRQAIVWTNDGYSLLTYICVTQLQWVNHTRLLSADGLSIVGCQCKFDIHWSMI